jgi:atypical dual specificity phosphatase
MGFILDERDILPDFPRTKHLPWKPNASRDDLIASEAECRIIFESSRVSVTEKVDGANVGIAKGPIIRNRNHILHKGYSARTAAKLQFSPIYNWYYENAACFDKLIDEAGSYVSVFGEWLLALHSVEYDKLPSYFLAYDVYDPMAKRFMDPGDARTLLIMAGFSTVPELFFGTVKSYAQLEELTYQKTELSSTALREGVYLKVGDKDWVTHRFKMVRQNFIAGEHFSTRGEIIKNKVIK